VLHMFGRGDENKKERCNEKPGAFVYAAAGRLLAVEINAVHVEARGGAEYTACLDWRFGTVGRIVAAGKRGQELLLS